MRLTNRQEKHCCGPNVCCSYNVANVSKINIGTRSVAEAYFDDKVSGYKENNELGQAPDDEGGA